MTLNISEIGRLYIDNFDLDMVILDRDYHFYYYSVTRKWTSLLWIDPIY